MNREIKFRFWHKKEKRMETPGACEVYQVRSEGVVTMQFTGIKDKNGNEIYEGDILLWSAKDNDGSVMSQKDIVEYQQGYFTVGNDCVCDKAHYNQIHKQSKVIGNIYENPKLLRQ